MMSLGDDSSVLEIASEKRLYMCIERSDEWSSVDLTRHVGFIKKSE